MQPASPGSIHKSLRRKVANHWLPFKGMEHTLIEVPKVDAACRLGAPTNTNKNGLHHTR